MPKISGFPSTLVESIEVNEPLETLPIDRIVSEARIPPTPNKDVPRPLAYYSLLVSSSNAGNRSSTLDEKNVARRREKRTAEVHDDVNPDIPNTAYS